MHMHGLQWRQKSTRIFHQKKILVDFKNTLIEKRKRNSKYNWSLFQNWNIKLFFTDLAHQIQQPIWKLWTKCKLKFRNWLLDLVSKPPRPWCLFYAFQMWQMFKKRNLIDPCFFHRLWTPNEGINQRSLKILRVSRKIKKKVQEFFTRKRYWWTSRMLWLKNKNATWNSIDLYFWTEI